MPEASTPAPESTPPDSGFGAEPGPGKGIQLALGVVVVAALLGWYGYTNLQQGASFQYFQHLDEFMALTPPGPEVALRVHGYVANDSIDRNLEQRAVRFRVQSDPPHAAGDADRTLSVVFASLETPDLFRDGAEVVLEGHMETRDGQPQFVADNVLAKCPSKFEAQVAGEQPAEPDAQL